MAAYGGTAIGKVEYQRPEVAARPVSLAPRLTMLAGREDLLATVHSRLTGGDGGSPQIIVLHGMGGVGKTSIAVEYAYRHGAIANVVWQFPAEDTAVLNAEFARLAALIGASGGLLDPRDPVGSVHAVLAASAVPWLLVFDNASDQESVRAYLPPAGKGRVLITSQSALWPPGQALEVPVLDPSVAAGFLTARTGDHHAQAAIELAEQLGGLPLALEQAAAYIVAAGSSLGRYLAAFRQRSKDLLARGEPSGYSKTVATTWALAFARLERDTPNAAGLLRLLACCAPEPVPLPLLLRPIDGRAGQLAPAVAPGLAPLLGDALATQDAVVALRRYSLVTPVGGGSVQVHRLVQAAVILSQLPDELAVAWRQAAAALVEAAIPADTDPPDTWPICAQLLPHAQAVLATESPGMARIANYLGESGSYLAARDLQQKVADASEQVLGPEHPDTLTARADLAYWIRQAGNPAGARDLYAALLPVHERVHGPEHIETLNIRHNLAWAWDPWDPAGARDQYAALIPVEERVLGPEHIETLKAKHNLAYWTAKAGDPAAARELLEQLLPVRERMLGPEHRDVMMTRHSLARWTGEAGDPAGARDQYAALLPVYERIQGPEHPEVLVTKHNLARWTGKAGDPAGARDLLQELLSVRERILGREHWRVMRTRDDLARWTGESGDPAGARDLLAEELAVEERVLGPEHPDALITRHNLARWTGEAGDPAGARDQLAQLLPVIERVLGHEHPQSLGTRRDLAWWTGQAGSHGA